MNDFRYTLEHIDVWGVEFIAVKSPGKAVATYRKLALFAAILIACVMVENAPAAILVDKPWDPLHSPNGFKANSSTFGAPQIVADDFSIGEGSVINRVAWWGLGIRDETGFGFFGTASFDIKFYETIGGSPPFPEI